MNQPDLNQEPSAPETAPADGKAPGFLAVMFSVMAAALGVQNSKNRERDFTSGNPLVFIAAGLIFTVLFVMTLIGVVYLVL